MKRTQLQFLEPLYQRLKQVAEMNDWSLADVVRWATELYVRRFSAAKTNGEQWAFPTLDTQGDYLIDPARVSAEADAVGLR